VQTDRITIPIDDSHPVSGLLCLPKRAFACYVMAHGAGAGMAHPFMADVAEGLARREVATLRFQFPYMEAGSKRPDRPALAHTAIRAAVAMAPRLPLFAGGKSFGARMTSQAQALDPLPGVWGLVFFGFPLHPVGKPSIERAAHLYQVHIPMLFLQGTRDKLADMALLTPLVDQLQATLWAVEQADHSFHVPVRSGETDADVMNTILDETAGWMRETLAEGR
jgi:predicted alpha/beta-hydrolase family hydrolase